MIGASGALWTIHQSVKKQVQRNDVMCQLRAFVFIRRYCAGLWEECSDNLTKQYLCEGMIPPYPVVGRNVRHATQASIYADTSGTQYGAVRAFMVLSVPAAGASALIAYKVAKDPTEIDYFRVLWYATSISESASARLCIVVHSLSLWCDRPHSLVWSCSDDLVFVRDDIRWRAARAIRGRVRVLCIGLDHFRRQRAELCCYWPWWFARRV